MERITEATPHAVVLTPSADGWVLWNNGTEQFTGPLTEAAPLIPDNATLHLTLPTQSLVIERLRLPATEREELDGMIRLQWEKELPFSPEELSGDFVILESDAKESTILAVAVPQASLERLCEPLRNRKLLPREVTAFVSHVAAVCPANTTVLAIYAEQGEWVMTLAENCRPVWVHSFAIAEEQQLHSRLPQLLLAAVMEGVSTDFSEIRLSPEANALTTQLQEISEAPIRPLPPVRPPFAKSLNLLPPSWRSEASQRGRTRQFRSRLGIAAAICLLLICAALTDLFILKRKAAQLDAALAGFRPQLELQQARQSHSTALAPAIDPSRYAVELLFLLQRKIPDPGVRLTEFDQSQQQWRIVGEAPSANLAIEYVTRIKQDPDLAGWQINAGPPRLLANERAQFSITGKP